MPSRPFDRQEHVYRNDAFAGYTERDGISDVGLAHFQAAYPTPSKSTKPTPTTVSTIVSHQATS